MANFAANAKTVIRTVYVVLEPMINDFSEKIADIVATEGAELALGDDKNWNDDAMFKIATLLGDVSEKLLAKLQNNDPSHGSPVDDAGEDDTQPDDPA